MPEPCCGSPFGNRARIWRTPSTCSVFHCAGGLPKLCGAGAGAGAPRYSRSGADSTSLGLTDAIWILPLYGFQSGARSLPPDSVTFSPR